MRKALLLLLLLLSLPLYAREKKGPPISTRQVWLLYMDKIARPVIEPLADNKLKESMPMVLSKTIDNPGNRTKVAYLEAFARTLCGISPWLNLEGGDSAEVKLREQYRVWTLKAVANAVNPSAKDYMQWAGGQPLVDAAFFSLALVRSPWLWNDLDSKVQKQVVNALLQTRQTIPVYSNWILFSGMIEAFFCKYGMEYDPVRLEYGIREFSQHWYTGDGMFSDGMDFHFDYYNSYVIQPYLSNIMDAVGGRTKSFDWFRGKLDKITKRYAVIQERMINTDGSFPVYGRSIVYRTGAFHHLADMALRKQLPAQLSPAQVRDGLTAVIHRVLDAPDTFTDKGYLTIGLCGNQPDLADFYINTGSCYLAATIFLPLGLPANDEFWTAPTEAWSSVKIWNGQNFPADHAMDVK
ncbi:DUF2264 domain-containing protein [Paludibacter jiangxiensis]|uniref:DUF2264 domain-containing protein n=1 Tax=Paludibacter jiangxiensis TaxID=681398 RepID=A0A171AU84_9BACT|nr:DUF2264 domain-containing protein [Paludibacter jiangxiensis]GAT64279.1 hypothetical protein PJIAN_4829 [Paludibacter jiangxiensis]